MFSRDDVAEAFKTAATLGVPGSKLAYAATIGLPQSDMEGMAFVENNMMNVEDTWIPLKTSYTQSTGEAGRPESTGDVSESTERGRDNDSNANKEEE